MFVVASFAHVTSKRCPATGAVVVKVMVVLVSPVVALVVEYVPAVTPDGNA